MRHLLLKFPHRNPLSIRNYLVAVLPGMANRSIHSLAAELAITAYAAKLEK